MKIRQLKCSCIRNATFENLEFLTVEQSLADIATFVRFLRIVNQPYNPKVILWGSGYGGTIATWARKKYPHLVDAVRSSNLFLHFYNNSFFRHGHQVEFSLLIYTVHVITFKYTINLKLF